MGILFLITFIDILGFGIIIPILPNLQAKFLLDPFQIGLLVASFSIFGLIGNLFFGILSDKIGRKKLIVIPTFLTSFCYLAIPFIDSFILLLIARSLTGLFTGNFSVCFASASDMSTKETRGKAMGTIGASFGLGFMLGPTLGGILGQYSFNYPFYLAAFFQIIASIIALVFFKETLPKYDGSTQKTNLDNLKEFLNNKTFLYNVLFGVILFLNLSSLETFFSIHLSKEFKLSPLNIGLYWTIFSIIFTASQLTLSRYIKGQKALFLGITLYTISFFTLFLFNNSFIISTICVILGVAISGGIVFPNLGANISFTGSKYQQGFIFGVNQSTGSLGRILGPLCLGIVYKYFDLSIVWLIIALIFVILLTIINKIFVKN